MASRVLTTADAYNMIATQELLRVFRLIYDETQSEFVAEDEILSFLNQASLSLFKQFSDPDVVPGARIAGKNSYFESSKKLSRYLSPFLLADTGATSATGAITVASVEANLGRGVYSLESIEVECPETQEYVTPKWKTNHQNIQKGMDFFSPTCCEPWLQTFSNQYQISPEVQYNYRLKALCLPLEISLTQDSEFPSELANVLAYKAARLAGIAVREDDFVKNISLEIEQFGV